MTKSRLFVFFTLTFMVTLLSIGIWGQEISYYSDPWMQTPGFRPEMPYRSLSENESVNIFNGNLTAIIPVGPSFPCGPSLSFQARLRYVGPYSGIEGSFQDYYGTRQGDCGWSIDSNVAYRDNAGKWVLMFGKIHEKIVSSNDAFIVEFVEQDGTIHSFYKRDYDVEMGYTNDGSGIRLFRFPGANIRYVVYMPSGTIMEFGHGLTHSDGADYFVTRVSDRDGNSYRLIYDYTPEAIPHHNVIKIYNEAIPSRQITFSYENQSVAVPNYIHYLCQEEPAFIMKTKRYLSKISMPAPRGSVVEYNLDYDIVSGGMPSTLVDCNNLPQNPPITTIFLKDITYPDDAKIAFEYYQEECINDLTAGNMHGSLKQITYPGGGTSAYEYSFYRYYSYIGDIPVKCPNIPPDCPINIDILDGVGVSKHTVDDGLGNKSVTTWYRPLEQFENHERVHAAILEQLPDGQLIGHQCKGKCNTAACSLPKGIELKTFYFDNANSINLDTFFNFIADEIDEPPVQIEKKIENIWEIGGVDETNPQNPEMLPQNPRIRCSRTGILEDGSEIAYSQTENSEWDGYGHYKVTKVFGTGLQAPKLILRKFNLTKVSAPTGDTIPQQGDFQRYPYFRNRQIVEVVSESDPSSTQPSCFFAGLLPSDDDPIPDPGGDGQLTSFPLYSLLPPAGTVTQSPNAKVTWMQYEKHRVIKRVEMNDLFSSAQFISGGIRAGTVNFTIDYTPSSTDNRITYEYDNLGQLVSAQLENALSNPAYPTKILYGWQNGIPSSRQFAGFAYFEAERTIDLSTGTILDEKDSNQLVTSFSYDEQGRLTKIDPPNGEVPTWISYPVLNGKAQDIVYYRGNTPLSYSGADPSAENIPILDEYARYHFDGLGRLAKTIKLSAANEEAVTGHEYSYQDIGYDAVGRKIFTSLPYAELPPYTMNIYYPKVTEGNSLFGSSFITVPSMNGSCPFGNVESLYANATCASAMPANQQKDPLGRVRTIIYPDGNVASLDYNGFDTITTIKGIKSINGSIETTLTSVKTSHYDALGRLISVDEPIGTDGVYRYDTMDRLIYAELGVQKRLFSYDTNGLLKESFQPENGLTKVLGYDVWGNPLQIEDSNGRAGGYVLENSYDLKGRKLSTSKKTSTETTLLSKWEYDQPSGGTYYLNRLTMEKSLYPGSASGIINTSESFRYDDPSGRISERTTSSTGIMANSGKSFHVSYGYDQYGRVVSEGLSTPFGQNMIFNNYMHGYLDKRIFMDSGLGAQKILYHPSGAIKEIQLNGSKKIQRLEEAGTGRLQEIVYGGWRTGSYIYDGAGNISQIGANDKFYYDELSRLKQASVGHSSSPTGAVDNIYSFEYKYDDFGNMWQRKITQTKGDSTGMPLDYSYNAAISTANNRIGSILAGSGSYLTGSVVYDPNGNQTAFNGWNYTYDELNRLKMGIKGDSIPRYYYNPEGERLVQILKTSDTDGESTYYFKDGIRTIGELQYKMSDSQVKSITEKFFLYVGSDILATSEKQYSMTVGVEPVHSDDADPSADFVARPCIKNYANGIQQQAIVSLSDVVAYESNGQNFDASYTLEHISQDIAGVMVRIARIKDQGNSNDNGNGCPRNDEDKVECRYFLKEGLDADFVFGGFGLCGNEEYGTISEIEAGQVYPVIFTDLQKDKAYRVRLYAWTSWAADPNLGFNIMKVEEGQLLVPKKSPSTFFEMRGVTTDEGPGFTGKLRAKWGQLSGTTGYNVKAIKNNGVSVILNGGIPITGNSYQIDEETALSMGVAADASYQLEAIIIDPTHPIIIGPIRDDLLPIKCTGGTPSGYSIPTQINVKVFTGQIAYISWDKGEYPAPYYRVFQRVSEPGQTLGQFVEIGVTDKSFFVYPGAPQPNEGELLAYSIQPLDEALNPVTNSSFAKLAEFISVTNTAPRPRNMSMGDGNRLVEVNWWGYATEGTQGPFGTSEPITFDSESGLYYELFRGYNPSMSATECGSFSLADFTLKQTTFEPYHEDTQFSASDENPLVAYKVRVNFEGNLPLPESECKWTHVGFCYDRPHVEWIHGYFTGNFNDDGAPIVTVEWAAAGPYSSTVYDLWRNGKYELYDITGTSITFAIGGHPDSTDVTHEFGVRAVNLPDGCLSDLVTCTVTVPGDVTTCPPQPGDILLMSSIVGPVYDENNELVGIKVQLVWSGETGSFIKIHRSFEECDQESPVIDTVSATQSCYYDILQSGQIAYYYVESGRNNCPKVGESECLTVSVLPQTGLNEGTVYFYVKDHLGNTRLVLDGEGNIQSRMSYEPYGVELYPLAANTMNEKYKFTNQERDYTTGLDYFHARYYGSAMGRFMRPDPVSGNPANPESWNLYSYVRSNPINRTDPTGLWGLSSTQETGKKGKIKVSYTVTKSKDGDDVASLVKQLGFKGKDAEKLAKAITEKFGANAANMQLSQLGGIVGRTFQAMESGASYQAQSEAKNKGNPEYVDCSMTAARIASPSTNVIPGQWDIHRTNNLIESLNLSSVSSGDERTGDIIRWGVGGKTHYANVIFTDDEGKIRVFSKEGGTGPFSSDRNLTDPFFNTNYGKITGEFRPED